MPQTLTMTEGVMPKKSEKLAVQQITAAFLKWHNLTGNAVMNRNVTATLHVLPKSQTFSGGEEFSGVWVEWKLPSFGFAQRENQVGYAEEVMDIVVRLSEGKHPKDHIYINLVHAVDGIWNFEGEPMTNDQILARVAQG